MARHQQTHEWRRALLLVPLVLAACATTPPALVPLRQGAPLVIEVRAKPPGQEKVEIQNKATGQDVSTGAGVGGVAGALWGLSCGPYAVLCVPVGLMAGLTYGSLAGWAVGLTAQLAEGKGDELRARLLQLRERRDLVAELRGQLQERARRHWTLGADPEQTLVTVEWQEVLLTSERAGMIGFILAVQVTQRAPGATAEPLPSKRYTYSSPTASLSVWLDEGNDFVDASLSSGLQQMAAQIVADLASR